MRFQKIIFVIILSAIISCRENKTSTTSASQTSEVQQPVSSSEKKPDAGNDTSSTFGNHENAEVIMPVIISFYSIGQGIDRSQTENLLAYIQSYEKKEGKKIEYSEVHWGREGETDFCFPMAGFSDNQVTDFLKGAKGALNAAEHVHFLQNQACRKGR